MSIEVETLKKKDIDSYIKFTDEIFGYEANRESIEKMIKKNKVLVIKEKEEVVASVSLEERFEYIKNQKYYFLSYLGVKKEYRRNHYASKLFDKVEELIKENDIKYIELTSGNQRRQAHFFYKDKQFKIKDTMVFIKFYN
ncbi:MAG: GNAT family N-acetyltransferase [Bacilli bacterium]|nr:GNAT family N-acetyltransferase [Bacilli bacterium]